MFNARGVMKKPWEDWTSLRHKWETQADMIALSFSGGSQSTCLLWALIKGYLEVDTPLVVVSANPGMEAASTLKVLEDMEAECKKAKIRFLRARGPSLYEDGLSIAESGASRWDNPPLWVKKSQGGKGQLIQGCTGAYKIAPIHRTVRREMWRLFRIKPKSNPPFWFRCEEWIGFSKEEGHRVESALAQPRAKFRKLRFPLHELGLTKDSIQRFYEDHDIDPPARSMCNGCFAHGLKSLKDMYVRDDGDWEQAVAFDESIRDLSSIGVNQGQCFVSSTLLPLKELANRGFKLDDESSEELHSCNQGICFT